MGTWLHRLTVWACYRVARKDRRRNLVELKVVPDLEPAHPFDVAAALADRDLVERSMNDLTLDHRAVIVLRFYLDLSVDEVARILDIPPGTVKSRIHRGLGVLRAHMADADGSAAGYPGERTA